MWPNMKHTNLFKSNPPSFIFTLASNLHYPFVNIRSPNSTASKIRSASLTGSHFIASAGSIFSGHFVLCNCSLKVQFIHLNNSPIMAICSWPTMAICSSILNKSQLQGWPTSLTHISTNRNPFQTRYPTTFEDHNYQCPWSSQINHALSTRRQQSSMVVRVSSLPEALLEASSSSVALNLQDHTPFSSLLFLADAASYSLASYYTSLGLFVISVPGLWSLIKRSVKSKIVKKTFIREGEVSRAPNQVAGEILSYFTRKNFIVLDRGDTITFEGMMVPSRGQAALLTFCTCISLGSVALVLTITVPDVGNNWFFLTTLSPLAGVYYWTRASRKEQIKVKMIVGEDEALSEVVIQGDDQQIEELRKELQLSEKGMVYVKGLFER